ncbi:MAG: hypothetical protein ABSG49_11540 [Methanoregula sp.]|uniref:hypothetical protein n=1 Tax=Methanoregula sp. TaxID=2052170 RepID=UPI003C25C27B
MKLPRGTFREIKKNQTIESILIELARTRFTGICAISSGPATGTIVLKGGKCILVKFQEKSGDAGWAELQKSVAEEVDAVLSTLDDPQVQLSIEFNKACKIVKAGTIAPQSQKPSPPQRQETAYPEPARKPAPAHQAPPPAAPVRIPPKSPATAPAAPPAAPVRIPPKSPATAPAAPHPAAPPAAPVKIPPKPPATAPAAPHPVTPPHKSPPALHAAARQEATEQVSQIPPAPRVPAPRAEEDLLSSGQGQGSFEKDIDTFDTLDMENVTDKIRNDCKTMVKQLHLEHLMER